MNADLRTESELTWYWLHSADEEQSCVRARTYEAIYIGQLTHRPAMIPSTGSGGLTEDVGLRCGPVYVRKPAPPYREPSVEPDRRSLGAIRLRRSIQAALLRLAPARRERLQLAFGLRPEVIRLRGWPLPFLASLPLAAVLHDGSGSHRRLDSWLLRLANRPEAIESLELDLAGEAQITQDARAYVSARAA